MRAVSLLVLVLGPSAAAQDSRKKPVPAHPKVDQVRVDAAIRKGVAYLKTQTEWSHAHESHGSELILWTFVKAGADVIAESDPEFQKLFKAMMGWELRTTYAVSLRAMILEELDRVKYQERIFECAQFLVDNQSPEGYWGYGTPTTYSKAPPGVPTSGSRNKVETSSKSRAARPHVREKPPVTRKIEVRKKRDGSPNDNSNTQYAMLGLRACHDAGIVFEEKVIRASQKWWREAQVRAGEKENGKTATGGGPHPPYGWSYVSQGVPYGSMTVGAIGGLAICDYILGESWLADKWVQSGVSWVARNFTVAENPRVREALGGAGWHYYYLYGLERAGMLVGTEYFGSHEWYPEGATFLLKEQKADGSWDSGEGPAGGAIWDTCWAILFLRRATRPLTDVASVDRLKPEK